MHILITGGAGFIGTHLARTLVSGGNEVTVLDNFLTQVHGDRDALSPDLRSHVRLLIGDIADPIVVQQALEKVNCIIHLAAETGTGQSMYEVSRYERTNLGGTAVLCELLAKTRHPELQKMVVASSRAIYGEGAYQCARDGVVFPRSRNRFEKASGQFDPLCPVCGEGCTAIPTPESAPCQPSSFYGLTKQMQEQTILMFGRVLGIPSIALRYQNVYGPGQSLTNPYTGILAIFSNLARSGRDIQIFEDGLESRDFVYIDDVVRATVSAATTDVVGTHAVNIGSGERTSVIEVARQINEFYGGQSGIKITGEFREGDVRHVVADLGVARSLIQYEPLWNFKNGLHHFLQSISVAGHTEGHGYENSLAEMKQRGMLHARN